MGGIRRRFYDFFFAENDVIPKQNRILLRWKLHVQFSSLVETYGYVERKIVFVPFFETIETKIKPI